MRTPPPSPLKGLDAVILVVEDFEAQCAFYREVLGLEETWRSDDGAFYRIGEQTLGLFAKGHHPEADARLDGAARGLSHLEFRVDAATREAWERRLREAGAHAYRDNFADADGNLFHFNED